MKNHLRTAGVVLAVFLIALNASARKSEKTGYQTATVVSVDKRAEQSNYIGSPSDAPLMPEEYSYDIKIKLQCDQYIGRYESATDYLPSVFKPNQNIDVRLDKHIMYVSLPFSDREVKMGIVGHSHMRTETCSAAG